MVVIFSDKVAKFLYYTHLTLKAPITTAAVDIHRLFFHCFSEKIRLDVSSESSASIPVTFEIRL